MRHLLLWNDSVRGEHTPNFVANIGCELLTCQIFTDEIPLGYLNENFVELVARQDVRPERPNDEEAPQLLDAVWALMEKCWVKNPTNRPIVVSVCDTVSHLLETTITRPHVASQVVQHYTSEWVQASPLALRVTYPPPTSPASPSIPLSATPGGQDIPMIAMQSQPGPSQPGPSQPSPSRPRPPSLTIRGHSSTVWCAALSLDGKYMVSSSYDNRIAVWDTLTGNRLAFAILKRKENAFCVAFSPDATRFASGSHDYKIRIWDAQSAKKVVGPLKGHTKNPSSLSFSPDGKRIASGSSDCTIRVWEADTGKLVLGPLIGHNRSIRSIAFAADGNQLVSGSHDTTVRTWDMTSGRCVQGPLRGHRDSVRFVAFSPDGTKIISAEKDGNVCVWDSNTGGVLSEASKRHVEGTLALVFTPHSVDGCAVSPNGKWIAYRNGERICISDSKTGSIVRNYIEHAEFFNSLSFSSDSKEIISASDTSIQIYTLNL